MPEWIIAIVTSHFLWGIVVGLLIAFFGARVQSELQMSRLIFQQKKDYALFAQDIISNIMRVCDDIEESRRRSKAIHRDLLALVDAEVGIFGRNREHSIRLSDDLRARVRKYVTDVALRRTDVMLNLAEFDRKIQLSMSLRASGDGPGAQRTEQEALAPLNTANKAADDLIATAKAGEKIINDLKEWMGSLRA